MNDSERIILIRKFVKGIMTWDEKERYYFLGKFVYEEIL